MADNPNERQSHNRRLAETLARAGIAVFPSDGKVPLVLAWQRLDTAIGSDGAAEIRAEARAKAERDGRTFDENALVGATKDVETVKRMWRKHKDAVPSISLGPSGLFVLDADIDAARHGPTLIRQWCAEHDVNISKCPITISQSGGQHIFFCGEAPSRVPPIFRDLYVQAKGSGGQVIAPGARRVDGKVYKADPNQPPLASAFSMGELPPIPACIATLLRERHEVDGNTTDAGTATLIVRLRAAELPEPLDPSRFVAEDKGGDRSAFRQSLANRMCAAGHSFEEYAATVREAEHAGSYVGSGAPDEGEYGERNIARDWFKAERRRAEQVAEAARIEAAADCLKLDDPATALAAIERAVAAGDLPEDECARYLEALENTDAATETAHDSVRRLLGDLTCGLPPTHALAALKGLASAEIEASKPDLWEPEHYREAKAKKATAKLAPLVTLDCEAASAWTPVEWLVDGLIPRQSLGIAFGAPDSFKSFALIHIASHVARGRECLGRRVERAGVVYWFGEGRHGIAGRFKAWALAHDAAGGAVGLADAVLNFASPDAAEKTLRGIVAGYEAAAGQRCELLIVDTLSKATLGLKENDNAEVAMALRNAELACKALDLTILFIAHVGKDGPARGVRGASAFEGNVDFRLEFRDGASEELRSRGVRRLKLHIERMKDARKIAPIPFHVGEIEIGRDKRGEPVTSLVVTGWGMQDGSAFGAVDDASDEPLSGPVANLTDEQRIVFQGARRAIEAAGGTAVAPAAIVAAVLEVAPDMKANTIRNTVRKRLVSEGLLAKVGECFGLVPETAA